MSNHETIAAPAPEREHTPEAHDAGHEQREALRQKLEKAEAQHNDNKESLESIHHEAAEHARSTKTLEQTETAPAKKHHLFTKHDRELSFQHKMDGIQPELSSTERALSKLIHAKPVETLSDGLSATVARPNALLAGSICAFLTVTILYLVAKHYGYQLSGFETIGAFALGWILGLIYDYVRLLIANKR